MPKISKKRQVQDKLFLDKENLNAEDAIELIKSGASAKFDETIDVAINLGIDPRHADQNIRVTTSLPHGTGKDIKVLVVTQGPKEQEAKDAGADYVGKEFLEKLKSGWDDLDKIVATPDMIHDVGKLGKVLGPKGLMRFTKSCTVTTDIAGSVLDLT